MLTKEQQAAVELDSDSILLIAGPGTGKTTVLVNRAARLLEQGVQPEEIMIATFSREAAESLKHRLAARQPGLARCKVGTFHSLAFDLMSTKPIVLDEETTINRLAAYSKTVQGKAASMDDLTSRTDHPAVAQFVSKMNLSSEMDYTGLACWLRDNTSTIFIKHLLVDEAQDNDMIQWEIVQQLAAQGVSVFCVMDPRQQIYEWRGATYQPGLELRDHLYLTESFRLIPDIAEMTNQLAKQGVPYVKLPEIVGMNKTDRAQVNNFWRDETRRVARDSFGYLGTAAILCRTNRTVERVSSELKEWEVPHTVRRRKPKQLASLIQCIAADKPGDILERVVFPDLKGSESLARLKIGMLKKQYPDPEELLLSLQMDTAEAQEELAWWARLARNCEDLTSLAQVGALYPFEPEVTSALVVSTIHQAKGLEYDTVIVPPEDYVGSSPAHYRLTLVQITRAKQRLYVCEDNKHLKTMIDLIVRRK